jgi:penicillin-binding protein 1C
VGVTAQYVVAVWLGNVDGRPSQALVGGEVAAPLLLDLCRALEPNGGTWLQAPERVAMRAVCRETGLPPSPQCTVLTEDAFIPLVSPMAACGCRAAAWVSADSAWTYCTACLPDSGFSRAWFPQYPPEVGAYFHAIGRRYAQPPPHALSCPDWAIHGAPRIVSPRAGRRYRGLEGPVKLVLEAQAAPGVQRLFWYLNRRFCQSGGPHERLLAELPKGPVEVSCTDDRGRTATVQVWVE